MIKTIVALCLTLGLVSTGHAAVGDTRVAHWQHDAKAVFLLMFDDSWPSAFQVAAPELVKRDMIATFYICPGKGEYKVFKSEWENQVWKTGMVYGNHTFTHSGVKDFDDAKKEIGQANDAIYAAVPGKNPRLISFAMPGVAQGKWNINKEQLAEILKANHLIDRPTFSGHGAVFQWKTTEQMLALADKAIASGGMEYLVIHGVERRAPLDTSYQDMWALNQDLFREVLDGLNTRRERGDLWITDHISYHQYDTERATAKVKTLSADAKKIALQLTSNADKSFYDQPLTLVTQVPPTWTAVQVTQGDAKMTAPVTNGLVKFTALPNDVQVELTPAGPAQR